MKMPSPKVRQWLYRIGIAGLGVLAGYGIITEDMMALWAIFAAALLGVADMNVPTEDE